MFDVIVILQVIGTLVLMSVLWPIVRLVSIPSIRQEYTRIAIIAMALAAAWCIAIVTTTLLAPGLLIAAAILAALFMVLERWRARAAYGVGRGLPPGSLTLVPRGPWVDERFYASQAKTHGPVFKMSQFFRPMVCVLGPAEGVDLLEKHADDLYSPPVRFNRFIPKGYIRYMARDDHAQYKQYLRNALNRKVLNACSEDFRELIVAALEGIGSATDSEAGGIHPGPRIEQLSLSCMLRLFLGITGDSPDFERLSQLYSRVEIGKASSKWRAQDEDVANLISENIMSRLNGGTGNLPPSALREICSMVDERTLDRTLLLNLVYMTRISASDLAGLLTWVVKILADNPVWLDRLRSEMTDRGQGDAQELAILILRESLRLERSEFIFRKARRTFRYKGFRVPRNWIVRVCIRDGHRDPAVFADPDTFDPLRFRNKTYSKRDYSPLGIGAHACLGAQIINVVGQIFLVELARSWRLSVKSDGPREYGRSHWQPSASFRISLHPPEAVSS